MRKRMLAGLSGLVIMLLGAAALAADPTQPPAPAGVITVGGRPYHVVRECPSAQYNFSVVILSSEKDRELEGFDLVFGVKDESNGYRLVCTRKDITLSEIHKGQSTVLATSRLAEAKSERRVEVQRRASALTVRLDGRRVLYSLNSGSGAGTVAIAPQRQAITVRDWRYQPVGDILFSDDFTRAPAESDQWESLRGTWKVKTTRESELRFTERRGKEMEPERSANFFYFTSQADPRLGDALGVVGYDFWDGYRLAASMRSAGGAVGLAFYVKDAANFYLARWWLVTPREVEQPLELVRVQDGKETVLARVGVLGAAGQWYRMEVLADGQRLQVLVDNSVVLDIQHDGWTSGKAGLYQRKADGSTFDDVSITSNRIYAFDTAEMLAVCGGPETGDWLVENLKGTAVSRETSRRQLRYKGGGLFWDTGAGLYWVGDPSWRRYVFACDVEKPDNSGSVGLAVRARDTGADLILRTGDLPGRSRPFTQLLLVEGGREKKVLAEAAGGISDTGTHEIRLDLTESGKVEAYLDGALFLRADDPGYAGACRPGLYAAGAKGACFRNSRVLFADTRDVGAKVKRPLFVSDRYMAGWASDKMAWLKDGERDNLYWHKSDFFGRFELAVPVGNGFTAYLASEEKSTQNCYQLVLTPPEGPKPGRAELARAGVKVAAADVAPADFTGACRVVRDGAYLWVTLGEKELLSYRDSNPLRGVCLGLLTDDARLASVEVRQYNVKDYVFDTAPSDWHAVGTWEETNRFSCDPRWSWFGATQWDGLAAIWNKASFYGNVTVEFYAGMRMATGKSMNYPRPGDINVTLCAQSHELATGYSAIYAAWDPFWTGTWSFLMRGLSKVAATDRELVPLVRDREPTARPIPVSWDPGGRPLHGAWYYIKVRKQGDTLRCYFDGVPVMEYREPNPLAGHQVALWTQENSIMVARARICYEQKHDPVLAPRPLPTDGSALQYAVLDAPATAQTPVVTSSTHPGVACDFEGALNGWQGADEDQGADLSLDTTNPGAGQSSLRLMNRNSGGTFGAVLPMVGLQPLRVTDFEFLYRIPPDVKVNFYLKMAGRECFIRFTGPEELTGDLACLGSIADVRADGQWHRASFPFAAAVSRWVSKGAAMGDLYAGTAYATLDASSLRCDEIRMGCYHEGYLRAGFGGNPRGATFWLDDFRLVSVGGRRARFAFSDDQPGARYAYSLSFGAPAEPAVAAQANLGEVNLDAEKDGLWYFNLKKFDAQGAPLGTRHQPFYAVASPPRLDALAPRDGGRWGGDPIRLSAVNVDLKNLSLNINGSVFTYQPRAMQFDWERHELVIAVQELDDVPVFKEGQQVKFELSLSWYAALGGGNSGGGNSPNLSWTYVYSLAEDRTGPSRVALNTDALHEDFEQGARFVAGTDGATAVTCDPVEPASGNYSLKVSATQMSSPLTLILKPNPSPFDAWRWPLLVFDYKIDPSVHVNLYLDTGVGQQCVRFTDSDHMPGIGAVPGTVADGAWHHAEVNLRQLLSEASTKEDALKIHQIRFSDQGYRACAVGTYYHLDNVALVPIVSASEGLGLDWKAQDTSSVKGYAFRWSANPDDVPDKTIRTESLNPTFSDVPEGDQYLHLCAQDAAGNWGAVSHYRFLVDNSPPRIVPVLQDSAVLTETVRIRVEEQGPAGIDALDLSGNVDGRQAVVRPDVVRLTPRQAELVWEWPLGQTEHVGPRADGSFVTLTLSGARDHAGNLAKPVSVKLRVDHAADKTPPTAPSVRSLTGELLSFETYGSDVSPWVGEKPGVFTQVSRALRSTRDYCLEVRNLGSQSFGVYASSKAYDLKRYPCIGFDYRFMTAVDGHIVVDVDGRTYSIALTKHRRGYVEVGSVANFRRDDRWHHADVDLLELISPKHPADSPFQVRWLFVGNLLNQPQPNVAFWLDNFALYGPPKEMPRLEWAAQDASGIAGYSFLIDDKPDTIPNAVIRATGPTAPLEPFAGAVAYFHIRAQDAAGNWGPASHLPLRIRAAAPPAPPRPTELKRDVL